MVELEARQFLRATQRFKKKLVPEAAKQVTGALFIAWMRQAIEATPVAEGRLRGGWQFSIGSIPGGGGGGEDKSGALALSKAVSVATAAPAYSILYGANPVSYINVIDKGGYVPKDPPTDQESLKRRAARRTPAQRQRANLVGGSEGAPLVKGGYSLQAPAGITSLSIEFVRMKADEIARSVVAGARRRGA